METQRPCLRAQLINAAKRGQADKVRRILSEMGSTEEGDDRTGQNTADTGSTLSPACAASSVALHEGTDSPRGK